MSDVLKKYTVVREYRNEYTIDEFLKRIIHIHIGGINRDITDFKGCSGHEVNENEK